MAIEWLGIKPDMAIEWLGINAEMAIERLGNNPDMATGEEPKLISSLAALPPAGFRS